MTHINIDAKRAVRAFFLGEEGKFGRFHTVNDYWFTLNLDDLWLLGHDRNGNVIWFIPYRERALMKAVFVEVERLLDINLHELDDEVLLGPLGLAALRATLTTTVAP